MSDPKVLEAQKWANSTYSHVSHYKNCPENGKTGWATMHSLLYGLQHELGIQTLAAAFGPSTKSRLKNLGLIGVGWNKNKNIIRIIQHSLFCKGYWGGDTKAGIFDSITAASIMKMQHNMGLEKSGQVSAELFRCLLNMDAYTLMPGGKSKIRDIQRWLNSRYNLKENFTIGPADGIYSRDVQKSLMLALQYELSVPSPTGAFGPGTQSALKKTMLREGSEGILVQLFSAACVFNEPVPSDISVAAGSSDQVYSSFKSKWDSNLTIFVKNFQKFSQLPETGHSDYQTWAQLLVSMGDANRKVEGCDTRFEITDAKAEYLKQSGYKVIGRYLYNPPALEGYIDLNKNIKPGELDRIFKYGMSVMPIFQDNGRRLEDFTYEKGYQHGLKAHSLAEGFGFNWGTTIYFAVDYDATQEDISRNIIPYFRGVVSALTEKGNKYYHGVYGSRNVCINVTQFTYARYSYVSGMSWGFSGNLGFPLPQNWSMNQILETSNIPSKDGNFDLDNVDWRRIGGDPGQSTINAPKVLASDFVKSINELYQLASKFSNNDTSYSNSLVCQYYRKDNYNDLQWQAILGESNKSFIDFADFKGISIVENVIDPVTGYPIDTQHLIASIQGHLNFTVPDQRKLIKVNAGDLLGWGGDLLTFYKEWRRNIDSYPSGYKFCIDNLGTPGYNSSFGFSDLLCDADALYIATQINQNKLPINTVIKDVYSNNNRKNRFIDFWNTRFINAENAKNIVSDMLISHYDPVIVFARTSFAYGVILPELLEKDVLDDFVQGFVDALLIRCGIV
ncbi:glycoside hydrolase domain-containing protein [Rothia nasisuis]|uniref:glycoside hydrolase domain-containing protein n=1 Tax=Rothia nasisuis TaxID=2109647 RepID=UPI001F3F48AD|nr:glycoside hydrolase domain-containing protein [Rothia nasisuis]